MSTGAEEPGRAARASRLFFWVACALLSAGEAALPASPAAGGGEGIPGWRAAGGRWRREGALLRQEAVAPVIQALVHAGKAPGKNGFRMAVEIRIDGGDTWRSAGLFFRRRDGDNLQHVYLSAAKDPSQRKLQVCRIEAGRSEYPIPEGAAFFPVEAGRWYALELRAHGKHLNAFLDGRPRLAFHDLAPGDGDVGLLTYDCRASFRNFRIEPLSTEENLFDTVPLLGPLDGKPAPPAMGYGAYIDRAAAFAKRDAGRGGIRKDEQGRPVPPYVYHAVIRDGEALTYDASYPAFHHGLFIDWFLRYWVYSGDRGFLERAKELGAWNLAHSTPEAWPYGGLPWSTFERGKPGGNVDGEALQPDKAAVMGLAYLDLHAATGEAKWLEGARRIAKTLAARQLPEGNWAFRVNPRTGAVLDRYTADVIYPVLLFEALGRVEGTGAFEAAKARALQWMLKGPVRTNAWTGFYEDVAVGARSYGNWVPLVAIRYLLEHRREDPAYGRAVAAMERYVEAKFLAYRRDRGPAVYEQTACYVPMNCHTLNFALTLGALFRATGRAVYEQAAVSAVNTATWNMDADGRTKNVNVFNEGGWRECWYSLAFSQFGLTLRFLEAFPALAPGGETHLLRCSSPVRAVAYPDTGVTYRTAGPGEEVLKLARPPVAVTAGGCAIPALDFHAGRDGAPMLEGAAPGFAFHGKSGLLCVRHRALEVSITLRPPDGHH